MAVAATVVTIGNDSALSAIAPAGTFKGTTLYWDEVGAIQLQASVADADYLGAGDVTGTASATVGRFLPDHFDAVPNSPTLRTGCSTFTYMGQDFDYLTVPVVTATAKSVQGTTTQNYTGSWFQISAADLTGLAFDSNAPAGTALSPSAPTTPSVVESAPGVATITFQNDALEFTRNSSPIAPFEAEIELRLNVFDSDSVAATNPVTLGGVSAGTGIGFTSLKWLRFGRLAFENAHGSELLTLAVPLRAEYYNGLGFETNTSDACTVLGGADPPPDLELTPNPGGLSTTASVGNLTLVLGLADLTLSPTVAGTTGYFDLVFDVTTATGIDTPWLLFDWDGDGSHDDKPTGRATFGIYRAHDMIIHTREIY
ncbi:MAG: DUF6701 domain-containing protein [Myxococcota bacterium]